jgi:UDP-perosamine 4-acetyltransferase
MAETLRCVILGGGGHARVIIDCLRAAGSVAPAAILDDDETLWGGTVMDVPVLGGDALIDEAEARGITLFAVGIGNLGDAGPRRRLFEFGLSRGLAPAVARHPSAIVSAAATIGPGCQLLAGAIVNAGARLGANVIVNTGTIVEHDCEIGDHAHIATGAALAGTVAVGAGALIGVGAAVKNNIEIGADAIVGAGAAVVDHVAPGATVAGNPARAIVDS